MTEPSERDLAEEKEYNILVNKMTNWQRHQWAKAGRPGLLKGYRINRFEQIPPRYNSEKVRPFINLPRRIK